MRGSRAGALIAACILCASALPGFAADTHTPVPYAPDEFPAWTKALWRAEAIFVGSFPFALFTTLEVYDTYRYVDSGFQMEYAPWPIGSTSAVTYDETETLWLAVSALSISLVVTAIDFIIERIHERDAKR
jgi:hypothetical protein